MARNTAYINKDTLKYICETIEVSVDFLARKLPNNIKEETILEWLDSSSGKYPTMNQAKNLAKILKIPFAALYMDKEIVPISKLSPKHMRDMRVMVDSGDLDLSAVNLAVMELLSYQEFLLSSEKEMDIKHAPLSLPSISDATGVLEYSKIIRDFFEISLEDQIRLTTRKFYLYVRQKIENKGVFIHGFTRVPVEVVRGISIYNEGSPIIGINVDDSSSAKTFTIFHELVHILRRETTACNDMLSPPSAHREEVFCNAVAGEVLVPRSSLLAYLKANSLSNFTLTNIKALATRYCVSREVIVRRLLDLKKITKINYDNFHSLMYEELIQKREDARIARKEGRSSGFASPPGRTAVDKTSPMISRMLLVGYSDGYFSRQDVSGYLGIKEMYVPEFMEEVAKW